ncbi:ATP-grasp domain-containing protein [Streptomyces sp. NBC_01187]|uniref:carboxylate--amine ligase n=1 Tax=Streptomyces sp. NBC_01187 TaxID=2903766 RepID=UPI00386305EB|nr:ATP-grasp domain-containing protein [Streptomyces sp. NBC_01187]
MPEFDTEVPVLLVLLDPNPFHHGTLGAVRSLGRAGIEVHALLESPHSPPARSRYLHRAHARPPGPISDPALLRTLCQVSERIAQPAVLIPMDDAGAIAVARLAPRLAGRFLLPEQPAGLPESVADKAALAERCRAAGIAYPDTVRPRSAQEAADAVAELGLPLVAKWSRPWLLPPASGLRSTTVVRTGAQVRRLYERTGQAGSALLLQRQVPGGPGTDWFFHGCFTRDAVCLLGGAGRKERAWPPRAGLTAVGRWLPNPEVEAAARRLAGHLGYQGILDLDFRLDPVTGIYHLLDFNPRPGAQFRLFTDRSGLDVVRALHLDLTGRPVPATAAALGRVLRVENYALLSALTAPGCRPRRARRQPPYVRAPRAGETAWFAADDPAPFLAMTRAWLGRGLRKGLRRTFAPPRSLPRPAAPPPGPGAAPASGRSRRTDSRATTVR